MIPAEQDFRHRQAAKVAGPGVLRIFETTLLIMRLLDDTLLDRPEHPVCSRMTVSISTIAGTSPPLQTKSPMEISLGFNPARMRSSKPS